jgi:hypothetical protein
MTNKLTWHQINLPTKEWTKLLEFAAEIFKEKIFNGDPDLERSMKVRQEIENSIRCYQVLYEEKRKKNSTRQLYTNFCPGKNSCMYVLLIYK